ATTIGKAVKPAAIKWKCRRTGILPAVFLWTLISNFTSSASVLSITVLAVIDLRPGLFAAAETASRTAAEVSRSFADLACRPCEARSLGRTGCAEATGLSAAALQDAAPERAKPRTVTIVVKLIFDLSALIARSTIWHGGR